MKTKIITSIAATIFLFSCAKQSNNVLVEVNFSQERQIGGISELDRQKYFNLCDEGLNFYDKLPSRLAGDYILDTLNALPGRMIGFLRGFTRRNNITEDPIRPGYADIKSIIKAAEKYRESRNFNHSDKIYEEDAVDIKTKIPVLDVIEHGAPFAWPRYMMPEGEHNHTTIPINLEAAAELQALALKHSFDDWNRPKYIEFINEYRFPGASEEEMNNFCKMHNVLARQIHKHIPETKAGGPCFWYGNFHNNNFTDWDKTMKRYIDIAHEETDFYSLHNYDFSIGGKRNITSGSRLVAILDLLENYSLNTYNEIKPFASSEFGATGVDHSWYFKLPKNIIPAELDPGDTLGKNYKVLSYQMLAWQHMRSINAQFMTYMNRPDRILKVVPFTLTNASGWDPRAHWTLYRHEGLVKENPLKPTTHFRLFEFWKDVKGLRVNAKSSDPDIQILALSDANRGYICLNNLAEQDTILNLTSIIPDNIPINKVEIRSFFWNGNEAILTDGIIEQEKLSQLTIKGDEAIILTYHFKQPIEQNTIVNEKVYYGDKTKITIDSVVKVTIAIPDLSNMLNASLRIGISRKNDLDPLPTLSVNGKDLELTLENSFSKQVVNASSDYYWATRQVDIPVEILSETNEINLTFKGKGGYVSSAVLQTQEKIH